MIKNLILIVSLFFVTISFSQATIKFIDTGSVSNQFDYLINKSYKYKEYKNVKTNWLHKIKANVADSLSASKNEILSSYKIINSQKNRIDSLKLSLNNSGNTIVELNTKIQRISFLGIQFKKGLFKTIMLIVIGTLALFLFFFITKFKQSNSITTQTKVTLKEVEEEFEIHRKKALEREQKVMRRLQDELNKQKRD